jgi:hypothetical protein
MSTKPMSQKISGLGRVLRSSGAARFYHNGDGAGFVWRFWHPLAWIIAPIALIASVIVEGAPSTWRHRHQIGFGMDPWFLKNPDKLRWE